MAADEFEDKIPKNFVIKVYETQALADKGFEKDALYIFDNGIDSDGVSSDPRVSNGSQSVFGTVDANTLNKVTDSTATFSDRFVGKILTNLETGDTATISSVDSETVLGFDSDICPNGTEKYQINATGHYFTFEKYYYRLEASDVVKGFIIDWDDGEDNSSEKANRQTVLLDIPNSYVIVEHTYTKHGKFYPMIRTISTEGFYSKWYASYDKRYEADNQTAHTVGGYSYNSYLSDGLNSIDKQAISAGQNNYSEVSLDLQQASGAKVRIPEFVPANTPPTANLQLDRASVFSGIDNSTISGNAIGYAYVPREGNSLSGFINGLEVIYKTTTGRILKESINASDAPAAGDSIFPSDTSTNGYLEEVLSVKIIKLKEGTITSEDSLGPDERLHILYHTSSANVGSDNVITTVSLGNPIQTLDRPGFSVLFDGSMSQTKCSNVTINRYIFDNGKLDNSSTAADGYVKATKESVSDVITGSSTLKHVYNQSSSEFDQESSKLKEYYNFRPNKGDIIDSTTKRFYDEERLIRLQVEDDSNKTFADGSTFYYSTANKRDSGLNTASTIPDAVKRNFRLDGNILYPDMIPGTVILIDSEQMLITSVNRNLNTLWVERGFNGTTAVDHGSTGDDVYILPKLGRTSDTAKWSFIEHWNASNYYDDVNRPTSLKSRGLLLYANSSTVQKSAANILGDEIWTDREFSNQNNYLTFTDGADAYGAPSLVFGGLWKDTYIAGGIPNYTQLTHGRPNGQLKRPSNWLLLCKTDRFNKIHIRLENEFTGLSAGTVQYSDTVFSKFGDVKVNISMWYASQPATGGSITWKPLSFTDGTSTGGNGESLRNSGTLYFDMPHDWVKKSSSDLSDWAGTSGNPVPEDDGTSFNEDPSTSWVDDMYGILIGISLDGHDEQIAANALFGGSDWQSKIRCPYIQTYNNSHSRAITIKDAHHKSLNDITIAQSVSWSRSGNIMQLADRFGRTELRKIGANGGSISFGGVELGGTNYTNTKAAILLYQREATPVYLDIERTNGDFVRFYGIIDSLSEDVPTGKSIPKWGVNMIIEYIAEFDSSGAWISKGLMSLGGEIIDEPKYLL